MADRFRVLRADSQLGGVGGSQAAETRDDPAALLLADQPDAHGLGSWAGTEAFSQVKRALLTLSPEHRCGNSGD